LGTGFYGSNDPTDSVKALKEVVVLRIRLQSHQVHLTVLQTYTCMQYTIIHTKMNLSTVKWAQWDKTQSRELLGMFICACIAPCTIVAHNIAHNKPDNSPSYPPDSHHCSDDVYLRELRMEWLTTSVEDHSAHHSKRVDVTSSGQSSQIACLDVGEINKPFSLLLCFRCPALNL